MTSAIFVSAAFTCSAYNRSKYMLYSYYSHTLNGHVQYTDQYQYITVSWPEGQAFIDKGWKSIVKHTEYDRLIGKYQDIYNYHDYIIY